MSRPPARRRTRLTRLGLPAVAVVGLGLSGCSEPVPAPSAAPAAAAPSSVVPSVAASTGTDGLVVRYLAADGSVQTVRVEDFPR